MLDEIRDKVASIRERVVKFRREIHRHPELSGREEKTSSFVAGVLEDNDIEVKTGVGGYGVVGLLRGGVSVNTMALRADMDALPIQEQSGTGYSSEVPGVMHACGHDVHTAILMGTAIVLSRLRDRLPGNVKFIFQPSEESSVGGAKKMIEDGALEDPAPSAIAALHCYPELEVGRIGHRAGIMTASSDTLTIKIKGRSGHASRPHQAVDAIHVASMVINAVHHIVSRRTDPLHHAVISIGVIKGGTAPNIISDHVEMKGTVRTLDPVMRRKMPKIIEQTVKGITMGSGAEYEFRYSFGSPSVVNDKEMDELVRRCAVEVVGEENTIEMPDPLLGSEDFAYFAERIPGAFFRLGTSNREKGITYPLHNPKFDVDEDALSIGMTLMSLLTFRYLEGREG